MRFDKLMVFFITMKDEKSIFLTRSAHSRILTHPLLSSGSLLRSKNMVLLLGGGSQGDLEFPFLRPGKGMPIRDGALQ